MEDQPLGRHAGGQRDMELTPGGDVEVHALLVCEPGHGPAEKGLGGVGDPVPPGLDRLPAGVPQVCLVINEDRRPELVDQLEHVDAADVQVPLLVDRRRAREEVASQGLGRDVVVHGHVGAGYGSVGCARHDGPVLVVEARGLRSFTPRTSVRVTPAPVAQRIEHRPPEPVAQVRVLPGAPKFRHSRGATAGGASVPGRSLRFGFQTGTDVRQRLSSAVAVA